jgi:sugar phosphate isomerase/epimerase
VFSVGFETVHFRKFPTPGADLSRLIDAAAAAGFDWLALNLRLALKERRTGPALAALAAYARQSSVPPRVLQSLVFIDDAGRTSIPLEVLEDATAALRPQVVSCNFLVPPTQLVRAAARTAMLRLRDASPAVAFAIEFGRLWPVSTLSQARAAAAGVDLPGVGLNLDSWHFLHDGPDWGGLDALPAGELLLAQLSDHGPLAGPLEDEKDRRLIPGDGILPLRRFSQALRDKGCPLLVGVEVIAAELAGIDPADYAARVHAGAMAVLGETE